MNLAIVILNWNGKKLLEEFLPSLIKHSKGHSIYIIDNKSSDNSINFINKTYPEVNIIKNKKNYGYAKGYNIGLKEIDADIFCLLNNDVKVTENWLIPIIKAFKKDSSIVVAQPKILDYNNKKSFEYAGAAGGYIDFFGYSYCRGRIHSTIELDKGQYNENTNIFWASGSCFFIRKDIFNNLTGFDEKFVCHMEEIDLCWRINNYDSKLKKIFIHNSKVFHKGGATLSNSSSKKTFYNFRNSISMIVKNASISNLFIILLTRIIIDSLILFNFLITLKIKHVLAIVLAYLNSILILPKNFIKRNNNKKHKHYVIKSIIFNYLILKKRIFSQLK